MTVIEIVPTCKTTPTTQKCRRCRIRRRSAVVERDGHSKSYVLVCMGDKTIPERDAV